MSASARKCVICRSASGTNCILCGAPNRNCLICKNRFDNMAVKRETELRSLSLSCMEGRVYCRAFYSCCDGLKPTVSIEGIDLPRMAASLDERPILRNSAFVSELNLIRGHERLLREG